MYALEGEDENGWMTGMLVLQGQAEACLNHTQVPHGELL